MKEAVLKIIANREELLAAARDALTVSPEKSPLPELECAYLATEDGKLTVAGGNLQVALERRIPVQIEEEGVVIIGAELLVSMLSKLDGESVTLRVDENRRLELTCGEAFYGVSTLDSAKYPRLDIPFPEDTVAVTDIPSLSRRTVFAASETDEKPQMKCVHLIFSQDGLRAVSSDRFRIAAAKGKSKTAAQTDMLIPAASFEKLARLVGSKDELRVGRTGNTIVFMKDDFIFSARLMQGDYFDENMMFSRAKPSFIVLTDAALLRNTMASVYAVVGEQNRFSLTFSGARLRMTCESEYGASSMELDTVPLSGSPSGVFWYSPEKLYECLKALGGTMMLKVAENGALLMETDELTCLQVALREPKPVERIAFKPRAQEKPKAAKEEKPGKAEKEKKPKDEKPKKTVKPKGKKTKKKETAEVSKAA